MHAVVFQVDLKADWDGDLDAELDGMVGSIKGIPGFIRGTWTSDGQRGLSFVVFGSEETARMVAANAAVPPEAGVTFRSADVYEIQRDV